MKRLIIFIMVSFLFFGCASFKLFPEKEYCPPEQAKESLILKWVDPGSTDLALMLATAVYLEKRPEKAGEVVEVADFIIEKIEFSTLTYDMFYKLMMIKLGPLVYVAATPLLERFKGNYEYIKECDRTLIRGEAVKQKKLAEMLL